MLLKYAATRPSILPTPHHALSPSQGERMKGEGFPFNIQVAAATTARSTFLFDVER